MALDIAAVQKHLTTDRVDGWLLYDFRGANPIAQRLAGLVGRHATRRWYYFIPASGTPQKLGVEHVALDGDVFAIDREIETYRLDALESTQALELFLVP